MHILPRVTSRTTHRTCTIDTTEICITCILHLASALLDDTASTSISYIRMSHATPNTTTPPPHPPTHRRDVHVERQPRATRSIVGSCIFAVLSFERLSDANLGILNSVSQAHSGVADDGLLPRHCCTGKECSGRRVAKRRNGRLKQQPAYVNGPCEATEAAPAVADSQHSPAVNTRQQLTVIRTLQQPPADALS